MAAALACGHRPALRPPPPIEAPATRPPAVPAPARGPGEDAPEPHIEPELLGAIHVVKQGETVYRIARTYGLEVRDLLEVNDLSDPRQLRVGMELFVPGARGPRPVPALGAAGPAEVAEPDEPAEPEPPPGARPRPPAPGAAPPASERPAARPSGKEPLLRWPVKGLLYSRFGMRQGQRHDGIDLAAPEGSPVTAAADGAVVYAGQQAGYGHVVILRHARGLLTVYAHNARLLVAEGDKVRAGDPIARVGQSGKTTGPHLHFEVREGAKPRDPLVYLK
ncbi:MAG: peptidoglycan DD-metalloendopeptidase family protein [Deltaproteobacteria bacterium]|nr:peptidoglycan DD-metalloendopeptidase family protein [Deltaproteobacteria bacterium]